MYCDLERSGGSLRTVSLLAGLLLFAGCTASASTRVDLDGFWQFKTDASNQGESAGWAQRMPAGTESGRVPGTWSVVRKYYYYVGDAWYFKRFTFPSGFRDQHVELHFGATFYKSRVWLNGTELGGHEGGYTAYYFDITPYLKPINYLAVKIDNRPGVATIPGWAMRDSHKPGRWYDWWPD
ncbi:MAG: sugar-binding domain-containing protein, partial [Terriglobia bacterium]